MSFADMLGFKLEMPKREDSVQGKTRPIYLDMQAGLFVVPRHIGNADRLLRRRPQ